MSRKIELEESSGNIFADLGLGSSQESKTRALIGFCLVELLKAKEMKQKDIAVLLHLKPAEVSHLFNGHFSRFSTDKLLGLLEELEQKVTIQISPRRKGEAFQEVGLS